MPCKLWLPPSQREAPMAWAGDFGHPLKPGFFSFDIPLASIAANRGLRSCEHRTRALSADGFVLTLDTRVLVGCRWISRLLGCNPTDGKIRYSPFNAVGFSRSAKSSRPEHGSASDWSGGTTVLGLIQFWKGCSLTPRPSANLAGRARKSSPAVPSPDGGCYQQPMI